MLNGTCNGTFQLSEASRLYSIHYPLYTLMLLAGDQLQQGAKKGSTVSMQTYSSQPSDDSMALGGQQDTETTSTASDAGSEGHIPCQHDASHGKV